MRWVPSSLGAEPPPPPPPFYSPRNAPSKTLDWSGPNEILRLSVVPYDCVLSSSIVSMSAEHPTSSWLQGKAGFPEPGCFEGAKEFPDTWCDFGCAIRQLDPHNKFDDQSMVWNYEGVDLDKCCNEHGFKHHKKGCECTPKLLGSDSCPPPPGFTVPLNDYDYDC